MSRQAKSQRKEDLMAKKAVIGLVTAQGQAEYVAMELQRAGFAHGDISVLYADKHGTRDFAHERHTKAPEGAIAGVGAGGVIGGVLGLLAGIGAIAIPGLGPFVAAGPIMALLSGAAAGATVGGITGALVGLGIPEIEAKQYESKIHGGNILLSCHVDNREQRNRAKAIFERGGARDIMTVGEESVPMHRETPVHRT
jgi:hypothetical protein